MNENEDIRHFEGERVIGQYNKTFWKCLVICYDWFRDWTENIFLFNHCSPWSITQHWTFVYIYVSTFHSNRSDFSVIRFSHFNAGAQCSQKRKEKCSIISFRGERKRNTEKKRMMNWLSYWKWLIFLHIYARNELKYDFAVRM